MNLKKGCLFSAIALGAIFAGAYCVITSSTLQTKIANSVLSKNFEGSSVKKVAISPFSVEVEGVLLKLSSSQTFTADSLSAKYFLPDLLFKSVDISELNLKNAAFEIKEENLETKAIEKNYASRLVKVEAYKNLPSSTKLPEPAKVEKAKKEFELPDFEIKIAKANADLTLILPDSSRIANTLNLSNLKTKKTALPLSFEIDFLSKLSLKQNNFKETQISAKASLDSSLAKMVMILNSKKILQLTAKIDSNYKNFETQTQLILTNDDIAEFVKDTPKFSVNLLSKLNFDSSLENALLKISSNINASELEKISANLNSLKKVDANCEISAEKRGDKISIANAEAILSANKSQLFRLKNSKSFEFNQSEISKLPNGELITLEIASISPEFINPFLKNLAVNFHNNPAKFTLSKQDERLEISTDKRLEIVNFSITKDGAKLVENISPSLSIKASSDLKNSEISLDVDSNIASQNSLKSNLYLNLKADKSLSANLSANGTLAEIASCFAPKDINMPSIDFACALDFANKILTLSKTKLDLLQDKTKIAHLEMNDNFVFDTNSSEIKSFPLNAKFVMDKTPFAIFAPFAKGANARDISLNLNAEILSKTAANIKASALLTNFEFAKDGIYQVRNLDASASLDVAFNDGLINANLTSLKLLQNSEEILDANSKVDAKINLENPKDFALKNASLSAKSNLAKLLNQPALQKFNNVHFANAKLDASLNEKSEASATLKIENLKSRTNQDSIAAISANLKSALQDFAPKNAELNLEINSARAKSEISANANLGEIIECKISANTIDVDDLLIVKEAFANPVASSLSPEKVGENPDTKRKIVRPSEAVKIKEEYEKSQDGRCDFVADNSSKTPEAKAMWDFGKVVNLDASARRIIYNSEDLFTDLAGKVSVNKTEVEVKNLSANLYGNPTKAEVLLLFTDAKIYNLKTAKFDVAKFPIHKFLKPNGAGEYFLEGNFSFSGDLVSQGANTSELVKNIQGKVAMNSQNGILRLIDKSTTAGQITSVGTSLLKISSAFLGNKVKELGAIAEITERIQRLDITNLSIAAQKTNSSLKLTDAKIEADPVLLILGGEISNFDFETMEDATLNLPVRIYCKKGEIGNLFQSIGFEAQENSNYLQGPQFEIYGNITKPENNLLDTLTKMYKNVGIRNLTK